ncbi:MAG: HAD-IA family hydrolase [Clostridia bacterium]|nr:HAD-IA family hydrolase [Clostridia bacterium]
MNGEQKVDTIIFDAGGVLFYINEYRNTVMTRILKSLGYEEKLIQEALETGKAFDAHYYRIYGDIVTWQDEKKWLKLRSDVIANAVDVNNEDLADRLSVLAFDTFQYQLFEETEKVLERLQQDYKLCVLSNATASLDWAFDYLDIRKYFDEVIISAYEQCAKPDQKLYHIALDRLGKSSHQCLFIDDKLENVEAARDLGMRSFHLIRQEGETLEDFVSFIEMA